jgi:hypothetical protein
MPLWLKYVNKFVFALTMELECPYAFYFTLVNFLWQEATLEYVKLAKKHGVMTGIHYSRRRPSSG